METILVTGAAGFIGSHTTKALLDQGYRVVGVDDMNDYYDPALKFARLEWLNTYPNFTFYQQDFRELAAMRSIFKKHPFNRICHLGARAGVRASLEDPFIYADTNIRGTMNLLELCREFSVANFVLASTSSVYGGNTKVPFAETDIVDRPVSPYAATKKSAELLCYTYHHLYQINCTILRFFTVYGPWGRPDMALFKFTKAMLAGESIPVYNNGNLKRDFTYVDDIVNGVVAALQHNFAYEIINLGNSHPEGLLDFITCLENVTGVKANKEFLPMQGGDVEQTYADITKAKQLLNFAPTTSMQAGIQQFVQWYRNYYKV